VIQTGQLDRETCGECGSRDTEFIQFADGSDTAVKTMEEEVGDGILELRMCNNCDAAIESVLQAVRKDSFHP
jgi:hypothetical protein